MIKIIILSLFLSLSFNQNRSTIFNTGSPTGSEGYLIDNMHSAANQFSVQNQYVLEAMVFYVSSQSAEANLKVTIREDNNGSPGQIISDLASWVVQIDPLNVSNYNLIVTTNLCLYLSANTPYWWTIEAADDSTQATWIYSNNSTYTHSTTNDAGITWNTTLGYAGAGGVWAEQIYENAILEGDVNFDFILNVIDIVNYVGHIIGNDPFTSQQLLVADLSNDHVINVVDIISLLNLILTAQNPNPDFQLTDINPASEYYSQNIGLSFFDDQVSCYYFGKQGWSTCKARFGILNNLYAELLYDGITDVKMMGINGYQYINDSIDCMICSEECTSSSCDTGPRVLPWAQDYDDGINCTGQNENLCYANDEDGDLWDLWDATLRDLIIVDRHGIEFARINLTYNNPDPTELGECTGNYQKIKDLILAARNR